VGGVVRRWFGFAGTLAGGLFVAMLLAVALHEICGHGLAAELCGGRFVAFHLNASFSGWAQYEDLPPGHWAAVTAAGSAVNLAAGLIAFGALHLLRRHLTPAAFALWLLAIANLGSAVGYTLQGLLFDRGDAGELVRDEPVLVRVAALVAAGAACAALVWWALRRLALYLEEQFAPAGARRRYAAYAVAVLLPLAVLWAVKPAGEVFTQGQRAWSLAAGSFLVIGAGALIARRAPAGAAPEEARLLRPVHALAALALAAATWTATALWLDHVTLG